jgi:uncharacterized protein (TIGR03435 family)
MLPALLLCVAAFAQSDNPPRFDAASIKPNPSPSLRHVLLPPVGGRLSTNRASLLLLIQTAYDVPAFQIHGGTEWMNSQGWDIEAKAEGNPGRSRIWLMLQSLLAERFQLRLHRETKELPVYTLAPVKTGLTLPKPDPATCVGADSVLPAREKGRPPLRRCGDITIEAENGTLSLQGRQVTTSDLCKTLSGIFLQPIVDRTGSSDRFDLNVQFLYDDLTIGIGNPRRPGDPPEPTGVTSIVQALQEKLGLKLEKSKAPVEFLVIEHAERPEAN